MEPLDQDLEESELELPAEPMRLNMGPSHPAMHGTVRMVLELSGETVTKVDVQVGYLHRAFEKMCERGNWNQCFPYVDRLNYVSPMLNNNAFAMAVEKLLGVKVPERCEYYRVVLGELARVCDHLTCNGAMAMELGAFTPFLWFIKARDLGWDVFEEETGARLTHSFGRVGGMAQPPTANFKEHVRAAVRGIEKLIVEGEKLLLTNRIFMDRLEGVGRIDQATAISYGFTGPVLRSTGVAYDVRKAHPYSVYDRFDFDVPVGTTGDNYDRFMVRLEEIRQSIRIIDQALKQMPDEGPIKIDDPRVVLPPKDEVYTTIEGTIQHFKIVMEGIKIPAGECYSYSEGGNGELGFYLVSDGTGTPYRVRIRPPCFIITSGLHHMLQGGMIPDIVPTFGSINMIGGECDHLRQRAELMPTIKLDGREIPFMQGDTIIRAAHRAGIDVPHYCWHPGLSVAANCRMCLVEILPPPGQRPLRLDILKWDEAKKTYVSDQKPKLQPACQIGCTDGMEVKSETSPYVAEARKQVQEFLLLNHPVDCPICDQAGECRLQDYWLEHGRYRKRMHDEILHKPKGVSFGPTIVYDAERCIVCTRCVRFCEEVANDPVLDKRERGNLGEIFVAPGRQLDNNYTLMTEYVCPVGALTAKDFRFKARVWFLRTARSICQGCATGCNAYLDYDPRSQHAYRYRPRDNEEVNKYWMCDVGMLSYRRAHEARVTKPRVTGKVVTAREALEKAAGLFKGASADSVAIVLSAQHSTEDNFALVTLAKTYLGAGDFYLSGVAHGKGDGILYHSDHNPNTNGAIQVASTTPPKPVADLIAALDAGRYTHVIALGAEMPIDAAAAKSFARVKGMVTIAAHEGPLASAASVTLPACSWAEMDGTYVNAQTIAQKSERAIFPQGDSRPAWEWVVALAKALGFAMTFTKLGELRKEMANAPHASLPPPPMPSAQPLAVETTTMKFLNEYQTLIFGIVKILIMFGFFLNLAPILVFAERRQAALIQDRIGPNRAMVRVPGMVLKGALATPMLLAAAALAYLCFVASPAHPPESGLSRGFWFAEIGTFLLWSHALILTGLTRIRNFARNPLEQLFHDMEDPRWIFYTGLVLHFLWLVVYAWMANPHETTFSAILAYGGPAFLVAVLAIVGLYAGYAIPSGTVELRVAGMLHSIADTVKLLFKEDFVPPNADRLLHSLAPMIALFPALVTYAVIPFGDALCFEPGDKGMTNFGKLVEALPRNGTCSPDNTLSLQIADVNVGILYLFAIAGTGIVGAAIAGWSSDNKWSLLGGLRAASQMVSYEVAMGLSLVGAFMIYGTPRLDEMVLWQRDNAWGIFVQPLAFFMFFAAAIAEQKRVPFDAPEGESEIIAGYFIEYSSMKFVMFMTGEYIEMITSSAILVTVFLGGWSIPFLHPDGITIQVGDSIVWHAALSQLAVALLQIVTFFVKVTLLTFWQIFIRWTVPRFRYDQIMAFGWKMLLPAAIANMVVTGLAMLVLDRGGPAVQSVLRVLADLSNVVVVLAVAYVVVRFLLLLLSPVERKRFTASTAAARAARFGGVKEQAMQA